MKLVIFLCALLSFSICHEAAFAQRFTTAPKTDQPQSGKRHDINTKAQQAIDSTGGKIKSYNAEKAYIALMAGRLGDARKFLAAASLSDPVSMYVRAALNQNAVEAADIYKEIVAENRGKSIGRDALIQLYKYHFAAGNYKAAHTDYLELQKYPNFMRTPNGSRFATTGLSTDQLIDPTGLKDTVQTFRDYSGLQKDSDTVAAGDSGEFIVQVGIFSTFDNARKFVEEMRAKNIDAAVFTRTETEKTRYAVSAGSFSTRDAAESFASDLKNRSVNCMVVHK